MIATRTVIAPCEGCGKPIGVSGGRIPKPLLCMGCYEAGRHVEKVEGPGLRVEGKRVVSEETVRAPED